ncbi:MAG: tripartite tricarboxylate transporter substrate-binding protein [Planctomycetota bacterium]|nr:tripartite tricarboxylate transporter substrate-binding protein [Planctomycetota bacterium]
MNRSVQNPPLRIGKPRLPILAGLLLTVIGTLAGCQKSTEYPSRPITLVCPWAVGGGTDRVSRQMAVFLESELGTPVNVVNAIGGQGVTGHSRGIRSKPDGYTISMMTLELSMLHWRNLTDLTWEDSAPLMSLNEDPAALFVRSDSPLQTIKELEAEIKSRPGELKASGTAALAAWHLALAGWLISLNQNPTDVIWMPSTGSAPSLQELMTGDLDLVCCSLPEAKSLLVSGDIRCLGVMADERQASVDFKDFPTLNEQGSAWTLTGWRGLGVAKDTPPEIQQRLVAVLRRIVSGEARVNGESFPEFMDHQGFDHTSRPTTEFADFLKRNDEMFGTILNRPEFQAVQSGPVGAIVFPNLAAGMLGLSLITILVGARRRAGVAILRDFSGAVPKGESSPSGHSASSTSRRAILLSGSVVAAVVFYILACDMLGFVATSVAILFVTSKLLGARVLTAAAVAIVASTGIYELFSSLLRVPLPLGLFW